MGFLRNFLNKIKPLFEEDGRFAKLHSVFDGFETLLFVPNKTSKIGTHIHDAVDTKRTMIVVVLSLVPALLFGMYNTGYQHFRAVGQDAGFRDTFFYGMLAVTPIILVSYLVGLSVEFIAAQIKKHEIHEGFLVTGFMIPLIVPVDVPLWIVAVATAFAVIFAKEVFGGTGMNIFNVALVARAFIFFAYPTHMSGDHVWVRAKGVFGFGEGGIIDAFSGATPLGQVGTATNSVVSITGTLGEPLGFWDGVVGLIPGSIGETSVIAIALGACFLLITKVSSWKTTLSVFAGGAIVGAFFNWIGPDTAAARFPWYMHLVYGGFAFGAVFMATDPVTSARTETGKWIYGFLVGAMAITIRVLNSGYAEGVMLAILLMNVFAPLIDFYVVDANVRKRLKRKPLRVSV